MRALRIGNEHSDATPDVACVTRAREQQIV